MGRETDIAEQILEEEGDYLLALKANHETAYESVLLAAMIALLTGGVFRRRYSFSTPIVQ